MVLHRVRKAALTKAPTALLWAPTILGQAVQDSDKEDCRGISRRSMMHIQRDLEILKESMTMEAEGLIISKLTAQKGENKEDGEDKLTKTKAKAQWESIGHK